MAEPEPLQRQQYKKCGGKNVQRPHKKDCYSSIWPRCAAICPRYVAVTTSLKRINKEKIKHIYLENPYKSVRPTTIICNITACQYKKVKNFTKKKNRMLS